MPAEPLVRWLRRTINVPGLLFILALTIVWEVAIRAGLITYEYLPSPSATARAGVDLVFHGSWASEVGHTVLSALAGWGIGSIAGILIGIWLGLASLAWRSTMASVEVLRALPAIAFVPAVVLLLGFSLQAEIVITTYVSIWPVLINTIAGVREVSSSHREVADMLRMPALERVRKILLPSAAPLIIVGLRLSLALSLALAIVAEMVGNPQGVGYALVLQQQALQPAAMFFYIISIGLVGLALNTVFLLITRVISPGTTAILEAEANS